MGPNKNDLLLSKYMKVISVVCLYWTVSISMVFLNKHLLGGSLSDNKDAPLFVTAFQCFVTSFSCLLLSQLSSFSPKVTFPKVGALEKDKIKQVFPLTCMFVLMITMNNLCLKYVGVAFYYVGRSLTTVFNVIFTYLILGDKTSMKAIMCCGVIIAGFWLGIDQEDASGSLSIAGVIFGVLASTFVSLNAIFTKKILPVFDESIWLLTYYNNTIAVLLFIPLILFFGESPAISLIVSEATLQYWFLLFLSGLFGFAIGYVTGLQIQVTSPLTHNISGTAKACFQTVIATWWFMDVKPFLWWMSNCIVLGGSLAYTRVKQLQMKAAYSKESSDSKTDPDHYLIKPRTKDEKQLLDNSESSPSKETLIDVMPTEKVQISKEGMQEK